MKRKGLSIFQKNFVCFCFKALLIKASLTFDGREFSILFCSSNSAAQKKYKVLNGALL
jgi:hypothetical protein